VVEHLAYGDHHRFPRRSLDRIERAYARAAASAVVVTAKDRVKIEDRLKVPVVELRITALLEPAFFDWLDARLQSISKRRSPPSTD
jgi:tetraacyldisaccharide-1-P 4'-kinase